ncbi:indole-3-glycerol phosphate synthase TrpC [Anaerosacchariphilus polymeriproducens]|uniref:Indole-3-glycerol phosphate synthase n=1 Tax=Anaerosacchariphilus polymeriproducens TaxID=1812858 RepID=A0A371AV56_9FIRM|nr:indole-3-glycerol phosphate synthase TrpC [Anaerosacchariphilus polymeriproducens]RDU23463.1 indole-3-glycerol phosphate synthase TrpC [Anaerosacchariphilus polymeriproducens]
MILKEIADKRRIAVENTKKRKPLQTVKNDAIQISADTGFPFEKALKGKEIAFICEVKRASPSKGIIAEDFPYLNIALDYEKAGAAAISVLTEPEYFLGKDEFLQKIANEVRVPVLRKDFTIDSYQIYEAKVLGASAILLICALLDTRTLKEYINIAHCLGLSALVEAHTQHEVQSALEAGARIIGVNNRDLKTFKVDVQNSIKLRKNIPNNVIYVSESGIKTAEDIQVLRENRVDAVLIGETLMRSENKKEVLDQLKGIKG